MSEMILLGAGASVEAKNASGNALPLAIPFTLELVQTFRKSISDSRMPAVHADIVEEIHATLLNRNPSGVDFEALGNAIHYLGRRRDVEIGAFFDYNQRVFALIGAAEKDFSSRIPPGSAYREPQSAMLEIERRLRQFVCDRLYLDETADTAYLEPLSKLFQQQGRLVIATLCYDNTIERMADRCGIQCETHFEEAWRDQKVTVGATGFHLLKLHGSVSWEQNSGLLSSSDVLPRTDYHEIALNINPHHTFNDPAIIFGGHNKLTTKGPYLPLLAAFARELESHYQLLVVGYSFRDEHINDTIVRWMNRDSKRVIRIVSPSFPTIKKNPALQYHTHDLEDWMIDLEALNRAIIERSTTGVTLQKFFP